MTESFFKDEPKPQGPPPERETDGDTDDDRSPFDLLDTGDSRIAAIMAYIPILCFVPLLTLKEGHEARGHARQGVILFLIELVAVLFLVDIISDLVFKGILLVAVGFSIAGIAAAVQGRSCRLPIIGDLAERSKL
ncbi:MAG: hypothetical protein HY770_02930 [Chitinivibrionia bacterium]|nr:hypothetical protein [Chitinivibrionia bacterium]